MVGDRVRKGVIWAGFWNLNLFNLSLSRFLGFDEAGGSVSSSSVSVAVVVVTVGACCTVCSDGSRSVTVTIGPWNWNRLASTTLLEDSKHNVVGIMLSTLMVCILVQCYQVSVVVSLQ